MNSKKQDESIDSEEVSQKPQKYRLWALSALTAIFVGLCVLVAYPFLPAITWGVALAIIAWPLHRWLANKIERPGLAAGLSTLAVVVCILVPGVWVSYRLAQEAGNAAQKVQDGMTEGTPVTEQLSEVPVVGRIIAWMESVNVDVEAQVRETVSNYTKGISSLAQGSVSAAVQFLTTIFILFFVFKDRAHFRKAIRDILPMSPSETDLVFNRFADSVHANLYATLITSVIDSVAGGFMFWLLGLPTPIIWAAVMFVLSLLPIVGAGLVWGPAALYLMLTGHLLSGLGLLAWGLSFFVLVDNIIYARLAGERMRMHQVPSLIAFLGGLAIFGISGMILGPAILAVTMAILEVWKQRIRQTESAPS